jgi:gluconate:H+ symporter, GntP family
MSIAEVRQERVSLFQRHGLNLPQPLIMIIVSVALGLAGGVDGVTVVKVFNGEFGRALGGFALILIPSFVLAACLTRQQLDGASAVMAVVAPVTAAGMICPDTSYAALSSVAGRHKLSVAFGSYAGYRLLFPAGPLIVATGLGIDSPALFLTGLFLLMPVWLVGELWARYRLAPADTAGHPARRLGGALSWSLARALLPLIVLGAMILAGSLVNLSAFPVLDFLTHPKGALFVAAAVALFDTKPESRREILDGSMRRSASLLVMIGAASAFGGMLSHVFPLTQLLPANISGGGVILLLFLVTMVVKVIHGSSMAAFATATPLLAPLVHATDISPIAAVFAICLGSIAIMPTDSFYWLVRSDALAGHRESSAIATLAGGALVQALTGFSVLYTMNVFGVF